MTNILNSKSRMHRLIGRFRLLMGFCPRCNSDAPAVDTCSVCKHVYEDGAKTTVLNRRQCYPLNLETKALWWYSWLHPGHKSHQRDLGQQLIWFVEIPDLLAFVREHGACTFSVDFFNQPRVRILALIEDDDL